MKHLANISALPKAAQSNTASGKIYLSWFNFFVDTAIVGVQMGQRKRNR
ncbi:MAG TPA: hypothetical protein PLO62_12350 [Candidatus Hydrogenedentes bacterium]|nr:hypothetical protein [Candidatus Hydrogenedentota bacterium]HOS04419.1 hypothetical protein [Candidatus Hydrogenedentota bacterium]